MRSHRAKCSLTADVVMQLILQIDEGVVALHIERNVAQNTRDDKRAHFKGLWLHSNSLHLRGLRQTVGR